MAETKALVLSTVATNVERRFWATATGGSIHGVGAPWHYSGVYSIFILDLSTNEIVEASGLDPAKRTNLAMYQFPMAPQTYECSESASTVITPTQEGGSSSRATAV